VAASTILPRAGSFTRLRELGEEIAARQEKALVFTQFKEMTGPLATHLERIFGLPGLVLHGSTAVRERQRLVEWFQGMADAVLCPVIESGRHRVEPDRRLARLSLRPLVESCRRKSSHGPRVPHRAEKNVLVHKFVCRGTIEERINGLIEEKKNLAAELLEGGGENLLTEMPDDELLRFVALDLKSAVHE